MQIPFSGLVMKQAPPEGDTFDGMFIPPGTRIAHNTLALQRLPEIYGNDAELFRPERWLDADAARLAQMKSTVDLVFGYGRWMCAGRPVAFMELNKVYVEVRRYVLLWLCSFGLLVSEMKTQRRVLSLRTWRPFWLAS
jgi:cytochrome P450